MVMHSLADSLAIAGVVAGRVMGGGSLTEAMGEVFASGPLRSAVQDLAFSALRDFGRTDVVLSRLLEKKPTASLHGLLLVAVAELSGNPRNPYAVVDQAVEAAGRVAPRNASGAKGLVNAVLRNFLRQQDALLAFAIARDPGKYRHPQWWIDRVRAAWPDDWEHLLEAANSPPPMILRVNARRMKASEYLGLLHDHAIGAHLLDNQAIRLERPMRVERLPQFKEGGVSVQDWGAQQAAPLLDIQDGMRVLDACAAPGGKTAHIAEIADCDLTACDVDAKRISRVSETLSRLGLRANVVVDDALEPSFVAEAGPYDRILADVPCSASGVVRRHPDIKWLRRESDLEKFARIQGGILASLWRLLAPGGKLLYATCSVFPEENEHRIAAFLECCRDARRLPLSAAPFPSGVMADSWRDGAQLMPGENNDGFFYALLEKKR